MAQQEQALSLRNANDVYFLWMDKKLMQFINQGLGNSALLVYLWLCFYAHSREQVCYPSITTLAKKACLGRRKVIRIIKQLEMVGIIVVERTIGAANIYRLLHFKNESVDNPVNTKFNQYPRGHGCSVRRATATSVRSDTQIKYNE